MCVCVYHRCIPNLISVAIELVCGGSPIACVLVECKAQHTGKWVPQQHRTSFDYMHVEYKCTVMGEIYESFLMLPISTLQGFPLFEVHHIGRATTGEPTLLEQGMFSECSAVYYTGKGSPIYCPATALISATCCNQKTARIILIDSH